MLDRISDKLSDITRKISGKSTITENNIREAVEEIKLALLEADVNVRVVRRFVNRTVDDALGETVLRSVNPGQQFIKIVHDRLVDFLGEERQELNLKGPDTLSVVLMMGLQGSGKTTSAAKLAKYLHKHGRKVYLIAADLVRPAAVDQLAILGKQIDIPVFFEQGATDPREVVKKGLAYGTKGGFNTAIIDTTGRLHLDAEMMNEIKDVRDLADSVENLLVADAMTGQSAVNIAKEFDAHVGITGVLLTKFDSDTRGGAAISLKSITGKPIKFIGVGEKVSDLEPFYPERIASRILGMGDVVSLVEKAQETIDHKEAEDLEVRMASATFTLDDYLESFSKMKKMGSMESLLEMIPGAKGAINPDDIDEEKLTREEAIILSMTKKERNNHRIIGPSRRKRIAKGSGTSVYQVNNLLKRFDKTRVMMKKVAKNKKHQAALMKKLGV